MKTKLKKIKETKKKLDKLCENPRYKALIKLGFWTVFIIIIAAIVRTKSQITKPVEPLIFEKNNIAIKKSLKEIKNYEATIIINHEEIIEKTITENKETTIYNNQIYETYENTPDIINKTKYFNPENIYELIKEQEEDYITNYKDDSYTISYTIPLNKLMEKYNNTTSLEPADVTIKISGVNTISKIEIDIPNNNITNIEINLNKIEK